MKYRSTKSFRAPREAIASIFIAAMSASDATALTRGRS
jgi:hypothetical protein